MRGYKLRSGVYWEGVLKQQRHKTRAMCNYDAQKTTLSKGLIMSIGNKTLTALANDYG
jgi:hypothetical protein